MTDVIIAGNTVTFKTTFYDENDSVTNPASAKVYVNFKSGSGRRTDDVTMTQNGNIWSGTWESDDKEGVVYWSIKTPVSPKIVDQGQFTLSANPANRAS